MIEVNHLTRRYGDFMAVNDVSFTIEKGEIVGLLGHNGAGKTTIMKMMTGYLEPTQGTINVDGLDVDQSTREVQRRIGYLPENCPLWPEMTVIEYLEYQASLHDLCGDDRTHAIADAIRKTELTEKAAQPIDTLSRGYRQRVGVAQAILHNPDIVVLDEPTNGLDPTQILHMRDLIRELAKTATVIVSTHILQEVQAVCDRVLILRSGRLAVDTRIDKMRESKHIIVTTDRDVKETLSQLGGIHGCTLRHHTNERFTFELEALHAAIPAIAKTVVDSGAKLFALHPQQRSLEQLFAEANSAQTISKEELDV